MAASLPRKLVGQDIIIHTGRPAAWRRLSATNATLLDFLRLKGSTSKLGPQETIKRLLRLLAEKNRYAKLMQVTDTEPPRARVILGAAGEEMGIDEHYLKRLCKLVNPRSRFNFGALADLKFSRSWQAREKK